MASETTRLTPSEEAAFQTWASRSGIRDLDRAAYDYRGFFKENGPVSYQWGKDHLPDTYKQHGHDTFSQESKYSTGPADGGMWLSDDTMLRQPPMAVSHQQDPMMQLRQRLMALAGKR